MDSAAPFAGNNNDGDDTSDNHFSSVSTELSVSMMAHMANPLRIERSSEMFKPVLKYVLVHFVISAVEGNRPIRIFFFFCTCIVHQY